MTADSLSLNTDERGFPGRIAGRRNPAQADIWEIRGYKRDASILAGAGIGAAAGAGLGLGARSNEDKGLAAIGFAVLGGVMGALLGRHAVIVKGEKIYVAP